MHTKSNNSPRPIHVLPYTNHTTQQAGSPGCQPTGGQAPHAYRRAAARGIRALRPSAVPSSGLAWFRGTMGAHCP